VVSHASSVRSRTSRAASHEVAAADGSLNLDPPAGGLSSGDR